MRTNPNEFYLFAAFILFLFADKACSENLLPDFLKSKKINIAHRGASDLAPEHTLASYELAIQLKADYIEPDLQLSRDNILICLHDETLERTTNVEEIFPFKYRTVSGEKKWFASDFSFSEIKQLDAGSWFDKKFSGEKIPAFHEVIQIFQGKTRFFPEIKKQENIDGRQFIVEDTFVKVLKDHQFLNQENISAGKLVIQSFELETLKTLAYKYNIKVPLILLIDKMPGNSSIELSKYFGEINDFISGIGPDKELIKASPELTYEAHKAGLLVFPWTFKLKTGVSKDAIALKQHREDVKKYLDMYDVDGVFSNYPSPL